MESIKEHVDTGMEMLFKIIPSLEPYLEIYGIIFNKISVAGSVVFGRLQHIS